MGEEILQNSMIDETKEIEINIEHWFAVIDDYGNCLAVLPTLAMTKAVNLYLRLGGECYQVRRKGFELEGRVETKLVMPTDFNQVNESLKVRGLA